MVNYERFGIQFPKLSKPGCLGQASEPQINQPVICETIHMTETDLVSEASQQLLNNPKITGTIPLIIFPSSTPHSNTVTKQATKQIFDLSRFD